MSETLKGKVALVAGASRGCGRGVAVALGEQAATVYVTGRSRRGGRSPIDGISGTIDETAEEVTRRGGVGIAEPDMIQRRRCASRLSKRS